MNHYARIKDALDWVGCLDDRFVDRMEKARGLAILSLETVEAESEVLVAALERITRESWFARDSEVGRIILKMLTEIKDAADT